MMRTTLNLDDEALAGAMRLAPGKNKTEVINEALREYARRRRLKKLLNFRGKIRGRQKSTTPFAAGVTQAAPQ